MPKKKKTLKQKMQADQRRQVVQPMTRSSETATKSRSVDEPRNEQTTATSSTTFTLPTTYSQKSAKPTTTPIPQATTVTISTTEYNYLGKDLLKTGFLTTFIVVAEVVIKFFFERG